MFSSKRTALAALAAGVVLAGPALVAGQGGSDGRRWFTYEQALGGALRAAPDSTRDPDVVLADLPAISGWLDDQHYLETRRDPSDGRRRLYAVRAADGTARVVRDATEADNLPRGVDLRTAAATSADGDLFIFTRTDDLYAYTLSAKTWRRLTATPSPERFPRLSPDGRHLAYTRDHDLYVYDLAGSSERRLTADGSDVVRNGDPSWVYMEEILGRGSNAFWWAPDSTQIAFMRFDDTPVPTHWLFHADGQHGMLETQRYPKAGDANPWVRVGVAPVNGGETVWMDFDEKADHYVAWPFWTPDSRTLTVQWMNRGQDTLRLYACDPATGAKRLLHEERQATWVDWYTTLRFAGSSGAFVVISGVSGWERLYLHGAGGSVTRALTPDGWRVDSIAHVDAASGFVYFVGRPGRTWDAHLMRVRLDGSGLETLTKGEGVHRPQVSPGGGYFIDSVSTIAAPASMALYTTDGTLVRELGSEASPAFETYAWGRTELFTIPSDDGQFALPALWILPADFDDSRQYPVIVNVYSGPDSARVQNTWPGLAPHYWAQRGVITVFVDHRGSGHFGKQGVALMHRRLGHWEMTDLIAAARWLRTKPFVAPDRIAITGASYGGYATALALTYAAEHFDFGVAASPVTDWRLYDTVYTERYMDTPAENPEGYRQSAVLAFAERYRGGLRLTHGTIDDNVHPQNTLQVVDWLTANDKRFELMLYPDSRHSIQPSQRAHAIRETHDFWVRTLLGGRLPAPAAD